jgi:hypothetical protein
MFFQDYFCDRGLGTAIRPAPLWLNSVLKVYLTDFLNRTFPGENAKNRAFCGVEKMEAASVYQLHVNQGAAIRKRAENSLALAKGGP